MSNDYLSYFQCTTVWRKEESNKQNHRLRRKWIDRLHDITREYITRTEEATGMLQTNGKNINLTLPIAHIPSSNPLPGIVANIGLCQNQGKVLVFLFFSVYTSGIFKRVTYNPGRPLEFKAVTLANTP